jgi:hypothetical protein
MKSRKKKVEHDDVEIKKWLKKIIDSCENILSKKCLFFFNSSIYFLFLLSCFILFGFVDKPLKAKVFHQTVEISKKIFVIL